MLSVPVLSTDSNDVEVALTRLNRRIGISVGRHWSRVKDRVRSATHCAPVDVISDHVC